MREIKKSDKYLCKVDNYKDGYFTKGNIYVVEIVNNNQIILLTDVGFGYTLDKESLNKDFTDLQEVKVERNIKNCSFVPSVDIDTHHDLAAKALNDLINKTPLHYQTNSIDVIDFCKLYNLNFNLGNIVKYACRVGKKDNDIEDLKKVIDYAQREIKFLENN